MAVVEPGVASSEEEDHGDGVGAVERVGGGWKEMRSREKSSKKISWVTYANVSLANQCIRWLRTALSRDIFNKKKIPT